MRGLVGFLNGRLFFWLVLALPSATMVRAVSSGQAGFDQMLHPSGEFSARLMIIALMLTPLSILFPSQRWIAWLMRRRRALGVAAFGYAVLHLVFYLIDMETLKNILAEFWALGIWTGWAALAVFIPLALSSNDMMMKKLGRNWKPLQRSAYAAAVLTLLHWMFIHNNFVPALVHFAPLVVLAIYRVIRNLMHVRRAAQCM